MKERRFFAPYMGSTDININASLSLAKLFKRMRTIDPEYKPSSRYQMRLKHKQAMRRMRPGVVR